MPERIEIADYAWVWPAVFTDCWVVDCTDCGSLVLPRPATQGQAIRLANLHNAIRHGGKGQ